MDQFTKNCELARMKSLNRIVFPFSSKADKNIVLKTGFLNMSMFKFELVPRAQQPLLDVELAFERLGHLGGWGAGQTEVDLD